MRSKVKPFDEKDFRRQLVSSSFVSGATKEIAEKKLEQLKSELENEFSSHPVTKELESGESSSNISGTLGGYGNLFSFFGFSSGENPTKVVSDAIKKIRLISGSPTKGRPSGNLAVSQWKVDTSSLQSLPSQTRMPWESGRSWLSAVEQGVSGFSYYLYGIFSRNFSRSGRAIQGKSQVRSVSFKRVEYFASMYSRFLNKLKGGL